MTVNLAAMFNLQTMPSAARRYRVILWQRTDWYLAAFPAKIWDDAKFKLNGNTLSNETNLTIPSLQMKAPIVHLRIEVRDYDDGILFYHDYKDREIPTPIPGVDITFDVRLTVD